MSDLAGQLALIAQHAPRLRAAGIHSLTVGDVSMVLLPPDPPDVPEDATDARPVHGVLDDRDSYGLPEGADLPGFRRPDDL